MNTHPEKASIAVVILHDQAAMTIGKVFNADFRRIPPDARIYEVAISDYGRAHAEGKGIGGRDGFHALQCNCKYNFPAGS